MGVVHLTALILQSVSLTNDDDDELIKPVKIGTVLRRAQEHIIRIE